MTQQPPEDRRKGRELSRRVPATPTNQPLPQRVTPQTGPVVPSDPDGLYDMKVAPGDPFVRAAYDRTTRATKGLGGNVPQPSEGTDSLAIHQQAKRSRSLTFTVQGTMWRAGFAKEYGQTPVGQASGDPVPAPRTKVAPGEVIVKPADPAYEKVFRELIPAALLDAADRMYGMVHVLQEVHLYYFPRDEGATTGIMAVYADGPASRRHLLYLQTNIKHASPAILDQMEKTFAAAVPKAREAGAGVSQQDFWKEFEKSVYQVKATFRNSELRKQGARTGQQITSGLKKAGDRVDRAISHTRTLEQAIPEVASLPMRGILAIAQGVSGALVRLIQSTDRMFRR